MGRELDEQGMVLADVVKLITTGKHLNGDSQDRVREALSHYQAKMDLVGVGITLQQMGRASQLAQVIGDVEHSVLGDESCKLEQMETKDKIALMKALHSDFRATVGHLSERAVKPTISSTDTMKKVPDSTASEVSDDVAVGAASRARVLTFFDRVMAKAVTVDVESSNDGDGTASGSPEQ